MMTAPVASPFLGCMLVFVLLLALSGGSTAAALTSASDGGPQPFTITLLHTSRVRGNIMPVSRFGTECTVDEALEDGGSGCTGGAQRRQRFFDQARALYRNVIAVDTGAYFWGSFFFTRFQGDASAELEETARYDVMGLSQEDFHSGPATLGRFIDGVETQARTLRPDGTSVGFVCSNIRVDAEPALMAAPALAPPTTAAAAGPAAPKATPKVLQHHLVVVDGRKIAFVGCLSSNLADVSSPGDHIKVNQFNAHAPPAGSAGEPADDSARTSLLATAADMVRLAVYEVKQTHPDVATFVLITSLDTRADVIAVVQSIYDISLVVWGPPAAEPVMTNEATGGEPDEHPYPAVITNHLGVRVPFVHAGNKGNRVGMLSLAFDAAGRLHSWTGNTHVLGTDSAPPVPPQPEFAAEGLDAAALRAAAQAAPDATADDVVSSLLTAEQVSAIDARAAATWETMKRMYADVEAFRLRIVGELASSVYGERGSPDEGFGVRYSDTPMGRLVADTMLAWCDRCTISLVNGGSIRGSLNVADLQQGKFVTYGDVLRILPFQSNVVSFRIKGRHLKAALINGISEGGGDGRFPQVAGARFAWNPATPDRLTQLEVLASRLDGSAWVDVEDDLDYYVASNSYLLGGGDGFTMLADNAADVNDLGPFLNDLLTAHFERFFPPLSAPALASPDGTSLSTPAGGSGEVGPAGSSGSSLAGGNATALVQRPNGDGSAPVTASYDPRRIYTEAELKPCASAPLPLERAGADCRIVKTNLLSFQLRACPTDTAACQSRMPAGEHTTWVLPGVFVNSSRCDVCSGLGACDSGTLKCSCRAAIGGVYNGIVVARGDACAELREEVEVYTPLVLATVTAVTVLTLALCLIVMALLYWLRVEPTIRASQPRLGFVVIFGCCVSAASVLVDTLELSSITCTASVWMLSLGYTLTYSTLFAKEYRCHKIFNAKLAERKSKGKLTDAKLMKLIGMAMGIELLLLSLYAIAAPLGVRGKSLIDSATDYSVMRRCEADQGSVFEIALAAYQICILVSGLWLAYKTRKVQDEFSESKWINLCVYNLTFTLVVITPVVFVIQQSRPDLAVLIEAVTVDYVIVVTVMLLYVPKLYFVLNPVKPEDFTKQQIRIELPASARRNSALPAPAAGAKHERKQSMSTSHASCVSAAKPTSTSSPMHTPSSSSTARAPVVLATVSGAASVPESQRIVGGLSTSTAPRLNNGAAGESASGGGSGGHTTDEEYVSVGIVADTPSAV